jgi:hypothetical protein
MGVSLSVILHLLHSDSEDDFAVIVGFCPGKGEGYTMLLGIFFGERADGLEEGARGVVCGGAHCFGAGVG